MLRIKKGVIMTRKARKRFGKGLVVMEANLKSGKSKRRIKRINK